MWETVWLQSLGVAAGFFRSVHWGLMLPAAWEENIPPDADVGRAALITPAVCHRTGDPVM